MSIALGFRGQKGGAIVVVLAVEAGEPHILASTFLKTHADGDRLSLEPYAVAHELGAGPEARAAVAEGRARQDRLATQGLREVLAAFGCKPMATGLLVNRAGWVSDLLEYSLGWAEHVPVAEGLAVREALRFAFRQTGLKVVELDEKSLSDHARELLDLSPEDIDSRMKGVGRGCRPTLAQGAEARLSCCMGSSGAKRGALRCQATVSTSARSARWPETGSLHGAKPITAKAMSRYFSSSRLASSPR